MPRTLHESTSDSNHTWSLFAISISHSVLLRHFHLLKITYMLRIYLYIHDKVIKTTKKIIPNAIADYLSVMRRFLCFTAIVIKVYLKL